MNEKPSYKLGQMAIYYLTEFINKLHVVDEEKRFWYFARILGTKSHGFFLRKRKRKNSISLPSAERLNVSIRHEMVSGAWNWKPGSKMCNPCLSTALHIRAMSCEICLWNISGHWRLRTASASVQYDQGIHCLYLGIEDSEQPALLCSMTRTFTVYTWALKTQNSQRFCAIWSGYSLSIPGHWRLRTASASVQYNQGIHCLASASVQYDQDIHCLYLGIDDSEQPALLYSMIRGFTVYIWTLNAQNSQHFCVVWPGHSLSISGHWRLRTASASVKYDQGIHCLYLGIENTEQPAPMWSITRTVTVCIWALKDQNSASV